MNFITSCRGGNGTDNSPSCWRSRLMWHLWRSSTLTSMTRMTALRSSAGYKGRSLNLTLRHWMPSWRPPSSFQRGSSWPPTANTSTYTQTTRPSQPSYARRAINSLWTSRELCGRFYIKTSPSSPRRGTSSITSTSPLPLTPWTSTSTALMDECVVNPELNEIDVVTTLS